MLNHLFHSILLKIIIVLTIKSILFSKTLQTQIYCLTLGICIFIRNLKHKTHFIQPLISQRLSINNVA